MALDKDLIDKLLEGYQKPEDLIGENGLLKQLTKALVERALNAELTHHLGYEKNDPEGRGSGNSRNGKSRKKLKGDFGEVEIEVPRDRQGQFEPKIVGFLCNWCSYAGADKAGTAQIPYPPNVRVVKLMCSGRVDPEFVLQAYKLGAEEC